MTVPYLVRSQGFALIAALLLMTLILMLMLSMSTLLTLELSATRQQHAILAARENARLGLLNALGELQKHAGPDQRVSARAEILGDNAQDGNRYWTGIWDTANPNTPPAWLISTNEQNPSPHPSKHLAGDIIELVAFGSVGTSSSNPDAPMQRVSAPIVSISRNDSYAWWIGDEGIKSSLGLPILPVPNTVSSNLSFLEQQSRQLPSHQGIDRLFDLETTSFLEQNPESWHQHLPRLASHAQRNLLPAPFAHQSGEHFHDVTLNARGLLTDTLRGGLKTDLGLNPHALGSELARYLDYPSYMLEPAPDNFLVTELSDGRRVYRMVPPPTTVPPRGEFIHSVIPVITDFGIQFRLQGAEKSDTLELWSRSVVEMWNPYSSALLPEELIFELSGIEPLTFEIYDNTNALLETITVNVHDFLGDPIVLRMEIENTTSKVTYTADPESYDFNLYGPGRIFRWVTPSEAQLGSIEQMTFGSARVSDNTIKIALPHRLPVKATTNMPLAVKAEASTLKLALKEKSGNTLIKWFDNDEGGSNLGLQFLSFDSDPEQRRLTSDTSYVGFQIRLKETGHTFAGDQTEWLKNNDPRSLRPDFADFGHPVYTVSEGTQSGTGNILDGLNPASFKNTLSLRQDSGRYFTERPYSTALHSVSAHTNAPLFELPRQPLLSVAQLQHVQVSGFPPYAVGNSWGQELNAIFDQYFFSGLTDFSTTSTLTAGAPVNTRYEANPSVLPPALRHDPRLFAAQLIVNGSFNLNSTSVKAWQAILNSSRLRDFSYPAEDTNLIDAHFTSADDLISTSQSDKQSYPAVFFRFPQSFQEHFARDYSTYYHASAGTATSRRYPSQLFQMGFSFLTPRSSYQNNVHDYRYQDDLSEVLAREIVTRIVARARPFYSMEEFLSPSSDYPENRSLLEDAIAAIPHFRSALAPAGPITIPERLPAHLSQADIMTSLAPILSTRSDTFRIRSYGVRTNPLTGSKLAEAYLEAIVQRTILPTETTSNSDTDLSERLHQPGPPGRAFQILSFQWLSPEDI